MKYKIGVFGSKENPGGTVLKKAKDLGTILAKEHCIIITGAGGGVPYQVVYEAAAHGGEVWGYSIATSKEAHKEWLPEYDSTIFKKLFFVPEEYEFSDDFISRAKYRNITSVSNCDAGIIISGGWGTLDEFAHLVGDNKIVGLLADTGGMADALPFLMEKIQVKVTNIIIEKSPKILLEKIIERLSS